MAWAEIKQGIQLITVNIDLKGRRIKALVNSRANKSYIYWKIVKKLRIQLNKKQEPYKLYGIGGQEILYNQGMVIRETIPICTQLNRRN